MRKQLSSEYKRLRGSSGVRQRARRLARTNGLCEHCLRQDRATLATVVNHKLPLSMGGEDVDENTENLCAACDAAETARVFGHRAPKRAVGLDGWPLPAA